MLYNKINLGGFPMRKKQKHPGLALTIVTAVFFVPALALFFLLPTIDNMIGENPAGLVAYDPIALWVEGWDNLISFNFASHMYMLIFVTGCIVLALLLFWLIAIIVKKKFMRLIMWFLMTCMCAACGFIVMGYTLGVCRTVTLVNGQQLKQHVILDLLFQYGDLRLKSNPDIAPYVFYNFLTMILGYAVFALLFFVALFAIICSAVAASKTLRKEKPVKAEKEAEPVEEPEEVDEEALAREKERQELIAYVEYKAGIPSREKEYEELCRANGIALPEDDDEEYYKRLARELPCLNEPYVEPQPNPEEDYYDRLTKELAMFKMAKASQDRQIERSYREVIDELSGQDNKIDEAANNFKRRTAEKRSYYERLENELGCLQYQKPPVEPEVSDPDKK